MSTTLLLLTAAGWGMLSAVALPIGAVLGLWTRPSQKVTSALMAFGGGAMLFALTLELFGHSLHLADAGRDRAIIIWTMAGALGGGLVFEFLNQWLNNRGAFLRSTALVTHHVQVKKSRNAEKMLQSLSATRFLRMMPPAEVAQLIQYVKARRVPAGETIIRQGDDGHELFFIVKGRFEVVRDAATAPKVIAELGEGETFGELALISDMKRTADVRAMEDSELYVLEKSDFDHLLRSSPALHEACEEILKERLQDISAKDDAFRGEAVSWQAQAQKNLGRLRIAVTGQEVEAEVREHHAAALAIWLGSVLDGVPESVVIGMLVAAAHNTGGSMGLAFVVSVFLANLPEAMSSAVLMQKQGTGFWKIFWMWASLCLMSGVGAIVGVLVLPADPRGAMLYPVACIEGVAAGAMLTMIANTMLPEAFEHGGSTVSGLSALAGFLCALAVRVATM